MNRLSTVFAQYFLAFSLIGFVGDSITATGAARADTPWPTEIEANSTGTHQCGSAAVGGSSVSDAQGQYTDHIEGEGFDILVIMAGINNINNGDSAAATWTTLEALVDDALLDGLTVYLFTVLPFGNYSGWTSAKQTELDALNTSIRAKSDPSLTILEGHDNLEGDADDLDLSYDSGDGLHLNAAGGTVLTGLVEAALP